MSRKQLILDAGGVIVTNLTPGFWEMISDAAGQPYESIREAYGAEIRDGLWDGSLPEDDFWRWLNAVCPALTEQEAKELLHRNMSLLPAFQCIPAWSELADVHILSNHRAEWLAPYLEALLPHLRHVVISSEAGAVKPSAAIFEQLHRKLDGNASILYVDDHRNNIHAAERAGWQGLLADEQGAWIGQVNHWLAN
ncbi:HAD-IA family hydrolase [Paenibacillus rhizovicinus]|uniref:HAD-IA family hydrolase n=1 Tax=Paenibacillus rhizovicinus TaxID=2704463 RepID=A0A6C0P4H5_9BACL|nr:HAD-IA family hydrolase [Paenibacillus rhizovicinus]QHW33428.1 HAD-IA family hydrolase [Paenibacillus rhizovicinus]